MNGKEARIEKETHSIGDVDEAWGRLTALLVGKDNFIYVPGPEDCATEFSPFMRPVIVLWPTAIWISLHFMHKWSLCLV